MVDDARPEREVASRVARLAPVLGMLVLAGFVYAPALDGPYVSDDYGYLTSPYTRSLDAESLSRMFDPVGDARLYTGNYAPVHLLGHALERSVFGKEVFGFHVVNIVIHALNAVLLAWLLLRSGLPAGFAWLGATWFVIHPANVEAVAWISQLKTNGALAWSLVALLALRNRPGLATTAFALALLTKASAAFALPMAVALYWVRSSGLGPKTWKWLAAWALIFGLYALTQMQAFGHVGSTEVAAFDDPWVQLRTMAAVGARYIVMAATSFGVSAFQEPEPVTSWLDPWWLGALGLGTLLGWRLFVTLRDRREEGAWWIAAAAAYAPVSQLFPFLIPVADRYLYFILPGLIGGCLLAVHALTETAGSRPGLRVAAVVVAVICVLFASRSHERAKLWRNETLLLVDAARHYPEGGTAYHLEARRLAQEGDADGAVAALRKAAERGLDRYDALERDPAFAPIARHSGFRAHLFELAGVSLARAPDLETSTQPELIARANAHRARQEICPAWDALSRALARGGPLDDLAQREIDALELSARDAGCSDVER